jgi:endonuclease-3
MADTDPSSFRPVKRPRSAKGRARETAARLAVEYPEAECELDHSNAYELLAATILSAQCTDARVKMVTPALFARYPTPDDLARADPSELEAVVRTTGFYVSKARNLIGMANVLIERFDGEVPSGLADLVTIPGVGRKTGNVIRAVVFKLPGIAVDTHVKRLANRLGLTDQDDPAKIERDLDGLLPAADRGDFGLRMILHGRRVCSARKPECEICVLESFCPSSQLRASKR